MGKYSQANRALSITTPLDRDSLLIEKFSGTEAVSELFQFRASMLAEKQTDIPFDRLLGQKVTVEMALASGKKRYFNGIVASLEQGDEVFAGNSDYFIRYEAEIVPHIWLLTRRLQSRIFQRQSVPDILKTVFTGFDYALDLHGTYNARDFVVQYRETDFAFASRLLEDEGIFYYFKHTADGHQLVLSDTPLKHPDLPDDSNAVFDRNVTGIREGGRIFQWRKKQEVRAGKCTLWDYCFQLNDQSLQDHLQASAAVPDSVQAGTIKHGLKVSGASDLELYEYPAGYAGRYDGIDSGGGDQSSSLANIFQDNGRTAKLRMEQETAQAVWIEGRGTLGNFLPGFQFNLQHHFNGDGPYALTRVEHEASQEGSYASTSSEHAEFTYTNRFRCVPAALPVRPVRSTPKPIIPSTQTATVVGPSGSAVFVDKYGRVKVQFHWDRQGKYDANSSCWVRVSQVWAGKRFGAFFWPRVGQEVVVSFEDGDPDQPLIVGSVYNSSNMPPFELPKGVSASGIKSCSLGGDPGSDYNWLVFHDEANNEHVHLHSENHEIMTTEASRHHYTPGPHIQVSGLMPFSSLATSGSGGGEIVDVANSFDLGSGAGGGLLDALDIASAASGEKAPEWLQKFGLLFPGSATYTCGNYIGAVLLGDQIYQTLGGAAVNFCFDPEAIFFEAVTPGFSSSGFLPVAIAGAVLSGPGGAVAMNFGPNTGLTYTGPNLSILRGESIEYKTDHFWFDTSAVGIGVKVLVGLATASAIAGDVAGAVMAAEENEGGLEWAGLTSRALTNRLIGLLRVLEEYNAKAHEAVAKTEAAVDMVKEIESLIKSGNLDAVNLTTVIANNAQSRVKMALNTVEQALGQVRGIATKALPNVGKNLNSDFSVRAFNIDLISDTTSAPANNPRLNTASSININAPGSGTDGSVRLSASQLVYTTVNDGKMVFSLNNQTGNTVWLSTASGNLTIQQGSDIGTYSQVNMANDAITLACGTLALGTKINQTPTNVDISAPAAGGQISFTVGPSSITLTPTGITLQFQGWSLVMNAQGVTIQAAQTTVAVSAQGLKFSALNTNSDSTLQAVFNAVKMEEQAQATAQSIASLFQNQ